MIIKNNNIYLLDYNQILRWIPDDSVDLICIDPPYKINYNGESWDVEEEMLDWHDLFEHFERILRSTGNLIIFQGWSNVSDTKFIGHWYRNLTLKNWIIYDRIKGRGAKTDFTSTREDILWYVKSDNYTFNKIYSNIPKKTGGFGNKNNQKFRSLSNVWTDISPIVPWSKEYTGYPCQKPVKLLERIINIFSNENDLVLDCFAGSGTVGVVCKNLNRHYIISDNSKKAYNICLERLK